jgi:hypothetical protein
MASRVSDYDSQTFSFSLCLSFLSLSGYHYVVKPSLVLKCFSKFYIL